MGSGIGTLIQGGSFKDAFKSALIAGATAGITQGIGQGFGAAGQTTGGFGAKLSAGVQGFGESITSGLSGGYVDQFTQGVANITVKVRPKPLLTNLRLLRLTLCNKVPQGQLNQTF